MPATLLIDFDFPPWHTADDTLDKVSAESLAVVGEVLLEALPAVEHYLVARRRPAREYNRAMPRVREIDDPGDDPILKETLGQGAAGLRLRPQHHQGPGPHARHPEGGQAARGRDRALGAAAARSSCALVYLRVALINGCPF